MNEEQMFNGLAHTAVASQMAQTMALLSLFFLLNSSGITTGRDPVFIKDSLQYNASSLRNFPSH